MKGPYPLTSSHDFLLLMWPVKEVSRIWGGVLFPTYSSMVSIAAFSNCSPSSAVIWKLFSSTVTGDVYT